MYHKIKAEIYDYGLCPPETCCAFCEKGIDDYSDFGDVILTWPIETVNFQLHNSVLVHRKCLNKKFYDTQKAYVEINDISAMEQPE